MSNSSILALLIAMFTPVADAPTLAERASKERRAFWSPYIEQFDVSIQRKESLKRYMESRLSRFENRILELDNDRKIENLRNDSADLSKKAAKAIVSDIKDKLRRSKIPSQDTLKKSIDAVKQFKRVSDGYFSIVEFDEEELQKYIDATERLKDHIDRLENEIQRERDIINSINGVLDGPPLSAVKKLSETIVALDAETSRTASVRNDAVKARQPQVAELLRQQQEAIRRQALEAARQRMWNQISGRSAIGGIIIGNSWAGTGGRRSPTGSGAGGGSSLFGCDVPACLMLRR